MSIEFSWKLLKKPDNEELLQKEENTYERYACYFLMVVFCGLSLQSWKSPFLWHGDYFLYLTSTTFNNLIDHAMSIRHPSGALVLPSLIYKLGGATYHSARLISFIPYILLMGYGSLWIVKKFTWRASFIYILVLSFVYPVAQNSLINELAAFGMLWAFVFFTTVYKFIHSQEKPFSTSQIQLIIVSFFFVNSLGQVITVFLLWLTITSALFYFYTKNSKLGEIASAVILSLLVYGPVQLGLTLNVSGNNLGSAFSFQKIQMSYFPFNSFQGIAIIMLCFGFLGYLLLKKKDIWLTWGALTLLLFPLFFHPIYSIKPNFVISDQYFVIWTAMYLILLFVFVPAMLLHSFKRKLFYVFGVCLSLFIVDDALISQHFFSKYKEGNLLKDDWALIYETIRKPEYSDTRFFITSFCRQRDFCENRPYFMEFFGTDEVTQQRVMTKGESETLVKASEYLYNDSKDLNEKKKLAILVPRQFSKDAYSRLESIGQHKNFDIIINPGFIIIKTKEALSLKVGLLSLYTDILSAVDNDHHFYKITQAKERLLELKMTNP